MIRIIGFVFALFVATSAQAMSLVPLHQPDGMVTKSAKHAVRVCTWSMVSAYVLPPAGTPLGAQLGCARWVVVALNECPGSALGLSSTIT